MAASRVLWIAPEMGQWEHFQATTPPLSGVEWSISHNWMETRALLQNTPDAIICGLWCPSGSPPVPDVDASQMLTFINPKIPRYIVLQPAQTEFSSRLRHLVRDCFTGGGHEQTWRPLWSRLKSDLLPEAPSQPGELWNELLLTEGSRVAYQFQSARPELRADLLSFLDGKRGSLEVGLGMGQVKGCQMRGPDLHCQARFLAQDRQLWLARHAPGLSFPKPADWAELQALRDLGVSL